MKFQKAGIGRDNLWKDPVFLKKLLVLALPIAIQNLMLASVAAADAFMLGNIEQNAMSAVSMATQIQFVQNMALTSAVSAFIILAAQYWGKRETQTISSLFWMMFRFCFVLSSVVFAGCVFFPKYLMVLFTNESALIDIGVGYLKIAGWSYLLTGISQCYLALLKISDRTKAAAAVSSGTVILNILLNAVFIFGLFGVPGMGARGAALATLIARSVEVVWAFSYTLVKGYFAPSLSRFFVRGKELSASFFKTMMPILGACMLWGVGYTSYTSFMGHLGEDAAAANSVSAVVRDLVCCLCNGIASGGSILVGNELGAGQLEKGKLYGERLFRLSFLCGFLSTGIMLAVTPLLLSFVKLSDGARKVLFGLMFVMAFYMIGRAVNTIIINGIYYAGGDTLFDIYSLIVCMWGIAVPLAALGTFFLGWEPWVVYLCTCLDEVGKIPWVVYHYRKYKWVKDLTIQEKA